MKKKKYGTYNGSGYGHLSCTFGVNTIDVTNYCRLFWQSPKFDTLWKVLYSIIYGWLRITLKLWGKSDYTKPWQKHIASYIKLLSGVWKEERRHILRPRFFWKFSALTLKKSTVLNGFFPYLAQMITSVRGCVAYNDLWPWPISSRSFGLGLENGVRSVTSTFLDGFFTYLVQMTTGMRRCNACDDLWPWPISSGSFDLDLENRVRSVTFQFSIDYFHIWHK